MRRERDRASLTAVASVGIGRRCSVDVAADANRVALFVPQPDVDGFVELTREQACALGLALVKASEENAR